MMKVTDFKVAFGTWEAEDSKEQIQIKSHITNGLDIPQADIKQILNDKGEDAGEPIIASAIDAYVMGDSMDIHPYKVHILGQDKIRLTHKETGKATAYNRINLP